MKKIPVNELPFELLTEIHDEYDEETAKHITNMFFDGIMTEEEIRRALGRSDIDPTDWQKFEDGWRPDNW